MWILFFLIFVNDVYCFFLSGVSLVGWFVACSVALRFTNMFALLNVRGDLFYEYVRVAHVRGASFFKYVRVAHVRGAALTTL